MQSFLAEKLIELTQKDEVVWRDVSTAGFTHNFLLNHVNGYSFSTEWLKDGRPQLFVNQVLAAAGYDVGVLIRIIKQQQERLGLGMYSRSEKMRRARERKLQKESVLIEKRIRLERAKSEIGGEALEALISFHEQ